MSWSRRLLLLLLVPLALGAWPRSVAAHAYLERAEPAPDAVLATAPATVRLWFTETIEPRFSEIVVLDTAGQPVHTTQASVGADQTSLTLALPPLPEGVYTVTWKNVSTVDGHPARGFHSLTIGQPAALPAAPVAPPPVDEVPLTVRAVVRWLAFAGQALLVGGLLTGLLVVGPALARTGTGAAEPAARHGRRRGQQVALVGLAAVVVAALAALLVQAATSTGLPLRDSLGAPLLAVLGTRYGTIWAVRVAVLAALAALLLTVLRRAGPPAWAGGLAGGLGLALLLTTSLTSHGAALRDNTVLAVVADWVHLIATSLWVGGLAVLVVTMPGLVAATPEERRPGLRAALVGRFSAVALAAVGVLVLTGAAGAALHLGQLDALTATDYGRALLLKLALLLPMLALGAFHLFGARSALARAAAITRPLSQAGRAAAAAAARAWRTLRRTIPAEMALGVLVLGATGLLTSLPPAPPPAPTAGLRLVEDVAGLRLALAIAPAQPGDNTYTLTVTEGGRPVDDATRALLRISLLDRDVGETEIVLAPAGDGRYVGQGRQVGLAGQWQSEIIVRRPGRDDARTAVRFAIPAGAPVATGAPAAALPALPTLTTGGMIALALLVAAGVALGLAMRLRRTSSFASVLFGIGGGAVALAVYVLATQGLVAAPGPAAGPRNPFPPTAQSLAQGRTLYTANCQSCHGATGKGDGPAGVGLNPPPLDLTQHVGFHPEGELFRMISQGVPRTAMAPYAGRLTDEERWHLVNYIRTFDATRAGG